MKTILIIDQEKNTTITLQKLLEAESFNVFSATTQRDAINLLNAQKFDLAIVSRDMPDDEGFDVFGWLSQYSTDTHIITLSASPLSETKNPGILAEYVKPLDFFSLLKTIRTSLTSKGFTGILNDISLQEYLQMFCLSGSTKAILVTQNNEKGIILVRDGNVVYAIQDQLVGEDAFFRLISWQKGTLKEIKIKKFPSANIHKDLNHLLAEAASRSARIQLSESQTENQPVQAAAQQIEAGNNVTISGLERPRKTRENKEFLPQMPLSAAKSVIPDGGTSVSPPPRPWLKVAAVVLPLLVLAFGLNSFFFSSSATDLSRQQNATAAVHPESGKMQVPTSAEAMTEKEQEIAVKPVEIAVVTPKVQMPAARQDGPVVPAVSAIPPASAEIVPEEVILRLHGSNTIGAKLAPALAESFLKDIRKAPKVEVVPGKANEVTIKAIFADRIEAIEIQAHGSTTGFEGLAAKMCDIAMSSRRIKPAEVEQLKALGDMTALSNEHVIALDGVAVIVNKGNSLQKLDTRKLADIFTGTIADWSAVQENPGPISVYARDEKSGTFDTFKSIVLGKSELKANTPRFESNPELSDKVAMDPAGIGFTSLPNIRNAKGLAIAEEGAGAIFPNFFTVATEDYPLSRRLYLYTETNPARPVVRDFVEYTHSRTGQIIAKDLGFVDLNIKSFVAEALDPAGLQKEGLLRQYAEVIEDAERLSLNFRFKQNLTVLDNRGMRDLDRMVDYLQEAAGKKIILSGFADNAGAYEYNRTLALERAETVAQELRARGIAISKVISAGEELPVASNNTDQGREKNRRVEVWVR